MVYTMFRLAKTHLPHSSKNELVSRQFHMITNRITIQKRVETA